MKTTPQSDVRMQTIVTATYSGARVLNKNVDKIHRVIFARSVNAVKLEAPRATDLMAVFLNNGTARE